MKDFVINFNARAKNWAWWVTVIPAFFSVLSILLRMFGVYKDLTDIQNGVLAVGEAIFGLLAVIGVNVDPTTVGISDSPLALSYEEPKNDKAEEVLEEKEVVDISKIIKDISALATNQVGYKPTMKSGLVYTKYHEELDAIEYFARAVNGYAYCCGGILWCFYKILGKDSCYKLTNVANKIDNKTSYVSYLADGLLKAGGKVVTVPEEGDIEIQGDYDHATFVTGYDGKYVHTVSFNSKSCDYGVGSFAHGVAHKDIKMYIRPNWDLLLGEGDK